MNTLKHTDIDMLFDKYSNNMASVLNYMRYKKDLHEYRQDGFKDYPMLPYINDAIDITLLIKLNGFFDKKYGLPLKKFIVAIKGSQFDVNNAVGILENELNVFACENAVINNAIVRLRNARAHVDPTDSPSSITMDEVTVVVEWIRCFIDKLHRLCGKSTFGYKYTSDFPVVFADVLDVLKDESCKKCEE